MIGSETLVDSKSSVFPMNHEDNIKFYLERSKNFLLFFKIRHVKHYSAGGGQGTLLLPQ